MWKRDSLDQKTAFGNHRFPVIPRTVIFVCLFAACLLTGCQQPLFASEAPLKALPEIDLPEAEVSQFGPIPSPPGKIPEPRLQDSATTAEKAVNYREVMALLGIILSPAQAVDPATIARLSGRLKELRGPRILSDIIVDEQVSTKTKEQLLDRTKAFRIFGQRFTLDGWILDRLTAGQQKSPQRLPSTPSALFIPAVMGDKAAASYADQYLTRYAPPFSDTERDGFRKVQKDLENRLAAVNNAQWFSSLNFAWLRALETLTKQYGEGYPLYMQSSAFPAKQLESFLGSYAELRHDTILYVKQTYAEYGEGWSDETPPPVPQGFVETNMEFWNALKRVVEYACAGFQRHGLFESQRAKFGALGRFKEQVAFYAHLAEKELKGEELTEAEYEKLRTSTLSYMAAPLEAGIVMDEKTMRSGLIADIHTDAVDKKILYESTGEPYVMLVLVGNENFPRLTIGVAFNHYEFTGPLAERSSDAQWQEKVYENTGPLPQKNFWYEGLIVK